MHSCERGEAIAHLTMPRTPERRKAAGARREHGEAASPMQSEKLAAVGLLAAGIVHEINNPLTAIIAYAQFLLKSDLQERQRADVEHIAMEAVRASRIVQNLLTFARPMRPQKSPISINDAVASALDARRQQFVLDDITIHTALSPGLPPIEADSNQLHQVFINILNNARDAMLDHGDGGHRLSVGTYARDSRVCVSFDDTGPGIPDACADRIFDPFFTTKEVGRGTGLGLAVCHGIVREHRGNISAHNLPQGGARFVVELPVAAEDEL